MKSFLKKEKGFLFMFKISVFEKIGAEKF